MCLYNVILSLIIENLIQNKKKLSKCLLQERVTLLYGTVTQYYRVIAQYKLILSVGISLPGVWRRSISLKGLFTFLFIRLTLSSCILNKGIWMYCSCCKFIVALEKVKIECNNFEERVGENLFFASSLQEDISILELKQNI